MSGSITVITGASQSGKTVTAKARAAAASHCLIWDIEGQYPAKTVALDAAQLVGIARRLAASGAPFCVAFRPPPAANLAQQFDVFSEVAWILGRALDARHDASLTVVAEEIADVTSPGKAPQWWGVLLRRGMKYGFQVLAVTQRPAESDKTCIGNCTELVCCSLSRAGDMDYIAKELNVPRQLVATLTRDRAKGKYDYLRRDMGTGQVYRGQITFKRNRPVFTEKPA